VLINAIEILGSNTNKQPFGFGFKLFIVLSLTWNGLFLPLLVLPTGKKPLQFAPLGLI